MEKMNENRGGISGYLLNEFSMDGKCEVEYNIVDDSDKLVQEKINLNFSRNVFIKYLKMARKRKINYYGDTDKWLYAALSKYPIENKNICIFGSANPWYEAIAIGFGAKSCNVIEYSLRESFDERICYTRPGEKNEIECDFAFSISSFEHDGLGRYGDPINPNGDIEAMEHVRTKIKRNGGRDV